METERHEPSLSLAFQIARLFEQSIEEIFDEEKPHEDEGGMDRPERV